MKLVSGLVLVALAVTAAHADTPNNLRSMDSTAFDNDDLDNALNASKGADEYDFSFFTAGSDDNGKDTSHPQIMHSLSDNDSGPVYQDDSLDSNDNDDGSNIVDNKRPSVDGNDKAPVLDKNPIHENGDTTVRAGKSDSLSDVRDEATNGDENLIVIVNHGDDKSVSTSPSDWSATMRKDGEGDKNSFPNDASADGNTTIAHMESDDVVPKLDPEFFGGFGNGDWITQILSDLVRDTKEGGDGVHFTVQRGDDEPVTVTLKDLSTMMRKDGEKDFINKKDDQTGKHDLQVLSGSASDDFESTPFFSNPVFLKFLTNFRDGMTSENGNFKFTFDSGVNEPVTILLKSASASTPKEGSSSKEGESDINSNEVVHNGVLDSLTTLTQDPNLMNFLDDFIREVSGGNEYFNFNVDHFAGDSKSTPMDDVSSRYGPEDGNDDGGITEKDSNMSVPIMNKGAAAKGASQVVSNSTLESGKTPLHESTLEEDDTKQFEQ